MGGRGGGERGGIDSHHTTFKKWVGVGEREEGGEGGGGKGGEGGLFVPLSMQTFTHIPEF